jgi:hypothetical protein
MAKSNLIKLAKGSDKKGKPARKPVEKKVEEKPLSPEEERDLKAKQKVKELLNDVELVPKENEEILEIEEKKIEGVDWLTEEVTKLTSQNEQLKEDYRKILEENKRLKGGKPGTVVAPSAPVDDSVVQAKLVQLFHELQSNYMKNPGMSPVYPGVPNFTIHPVAFMERMIMFFPFLGKERRYKA